MKPKKIVAKTSYLFLINLFRVLFILNLIFLLVSILAVVTEFNKDSVFMLAISSIFTAGFYIAILKVRKKYLGDFPEDRTIVDITEGPETVDLDIHCHSCGSDYVEPEYKTYLCYDCRTKLSSRKIALPAAIFAILILLSSFVGYYNIVERVDDKISYERGKRYLKEKNYVEAEKYLSKFSEKFPDDISLHGRLFIAQVYVQKYSEALDTYKKIEGKEFYDKEFVEEIKQAASIFEKGEK